MEWKQLQTSYEMIRSLTFFKHFMIRKYFQSWKHGNSSNFHRDFSLKLQKFDTDLIAELENTFPRYVCGPNHYLYLGIENSWKILTISLQQVQKVVLRFQNAFIPDMKQKSTFYDEDFIEIHAQKNKEVNSLLRDMSAQLQGISISTTLKIRLECNHNM